MAVSSAAEDSTASPPQATSSGAGVEWTRDQEKAFENALAAEPHDGDDGLWERIAAAVEGKTADEVRLHYELLVEDIGSIQAGRVPLPVYVSHGSGDEDGESNVGGGKKGGHGEKGGCRSEQERRRGIAWSEDEHRLFLLGLERYGKGDWRSISRKFVISRTPTQVASHAQKYFIRLNSVNKERRRSSIHDITSVNNGDASSTQGPITGQEPGKSSKQPP